MDRHLQTCLDEALRAGSQPTQRLTAAARSPAWALLPEGAKGLLRMALLQEMPKGSDAAPGAWPGARPARRVAGGRRRPGAARRSGPREGMEQLPELETLVSQYQEHLPFAFAALLARTAFGEGEGMNEVDQCLGTWRLTLEGDGVTSVWHRLGELWPPVAELQRYPEVSRAASKSEDPPAEWWQEARLDPADPEQLAAFLSPPYPFDLDAEAELDLKRLHEHLAAQRGGRSEDVLARHTVAKPLEALDGAARIYPTMLAVARADEDALERLDALADAQPKLAEWAAAHAALVRLRRGELERWEADRQAEGDDALAEARRREAWLAIPPSAAGLGVEALEAGRSAIEAAATLGGAFAERAEVALRSLDWWLVAALDQAGRGSDAVALVQGLHPSSEEHLAVVRDLVAASPAGELNTWILERLPDLKPGLAAALLDDARLPEPLRLQAAAQLQDVGGELWAGRAAASLPLFVAANDPVRLSLALKVIEDAALVHPYETLLASHLHPAETDLKRITWRSEARRQALAALDSAEPPEQLTPLSLFLLRLLDGFSASADAVTAVLDRRGLLAFNQVRRAMGVGGDVLVADEKLRDLEASLGDADLAPLERSLFEMVIGTLRLSRAATLLQDHEADRRTDAEAMIRELIERPAPVGRFLGAVRKLVLEHDLGLASLVEWYREHDPTHPWNLVVRAALDARREAHLPAARNYRQAGDHADVDFETSIILQRKALIEYARAARYGEAMELLERQPALGSTLTDLFRLYLRVCDSATRGDNDAAVAALLTFVEVEEQVEGRDGEGEVLLTSQRRPSEDRLEMMFDYPYMVAHELPSVPWQGRVTAALQRLRSVRRRRNWELERDFQRALEDKALEELQFLADELASEQERPRQALLLYERAQNAEVFRPREQQRLNSAERALFEIVQHAIPVRERWVLRNLTLKPLVLVDTNLLIDALRDELARELKVDMDLALDFHGVRAFHRTLLTLRDEGTVHLRVPSAAAEEVLGIARTPQRLRAQFRDVYVDDELWSTLVAGDAIQTMAKATIEQFDGWRAPAGALPDDTDSLDAPGWDEQLRADLDEFLLQRHQIYRELSQVKAQHTSTERTRVQRSQAIYPEGGDLRIILEASTLASQPLKQLGSVLLATRDGDFTLVSRALEEHFGFGIVSNAQLLSRWIH